MFCSLKVIVIYDHFVYAYSFILCSLEKSAGSQLTLIPFQTMLKKRFFEHCVTTTTIQWKWNTFCQPQRKPVIYRLKTLLLFSTRLSVRTQENRDLKVHQFPLRTNKLFLVSELISSLFMSFNNYKSIQTSDPKFKV